MINIKPKKRQYAKPVFGRQPGQEKSQNLEIWLKAGVNLKTSKKLIFFFFQ